MALFQNSNASATILPNHKQENRPRKAAKANKLLSSKRTREQTTNNSLERTANGNVTFKVIANQSEKKDARTIDNLERLESSHETADIIDI